MPPRFATVWFVTEGHKLTSRSGEGWNRSAGRVGGWHTNQGREMSECENNIVFGERRCIRVQTATRTNLFSVQQLQIIEFGKLLGIRLEQIQLQPYCLGAGGRGRWQRWRVHAGRCRQRRISAVAGRRLHRLFAFALAYCCQINTFYIGHFIFFFETVFHTIFFSFLLLFSLNKK